MNIWQLQEAKARFSELTRSCKIEPQIISVRGKDEFIMMSLDEYKKIMGAKKSLFELLQQSTLADCDIEFTRDKSENREIEL